MMWNFLKKKRFLGPIISMALALSFLFAPVSQTLEVKRVDAIYYDPYNTIVNTISSVADVASEVSGFLIKQKELYLDGIAWALTNVMVKQMIKSMTQWVNNGFEGSPAFVTDLEKFMRDTADEVAGQFIWESEDLNFLCSPFALDIKVALETQYSQTRDFQSQCTLSDVVGNMDNFLSGDFLEGGWDGWYELTQNPKSNPYGAFLDAQAALAVKIGNKQLYEQKLLDFGEGFFSKKKCETFVVEDGTGTTEVCQTVTPGSTIESQLNTALSLPAGRLQVADELNELLGALFSQLVSSIFSSAGGLLGSTGSGGIFDQIDRERTPGSQGPESSPLEVILQREREYSDLLAEIVDMITGAKNYWENTYAENDEDPRTDREEQCYEEGVTKFPASLAQRLTETETELATLQQTIATLEDLEADYLVLDDPGSSESALAALRVKYNASTTPAAKTEVMKRIGQFQSSGVLHGAGEIGRLQAETIPGIRERIKNFIEAVDRVCGGDDGGGG